MSDCFVEDIEDNIKLANTQSNLTPMTVYYIDCNMAQFSNKKGENLNESIIRKNGISQLAIELWKNIYKNDNNINNINNKWDAKHKYSRFWTIYFINNNLSYLCDYDEWWDLGGIAKDIFHKYVYFNL